MILAISEERCCVVSVVGKKKKTEILFWNHLKWKGKRMKYYPEMTFENNTPNGELYQIASFLSAASTRLSPAVC